MGIRGAWSVVSSDPRRFGEPWVCCVEESVIWIDGPSLVYYLALQPKFDQVDRFHERYNQIGQASPACIHKRAINFITVLTQLAKEVHVVMDGLCSASKIPTQIERMKFAAREAEEAARLSTAPRNCKVVSVLAEWTVVDAIEDLQERITTLQLHRLSSGEAEAFIDANMRQHTDKEAVVIISNDTDYLVYENCPGFLPFSSLQFTPIEEDGRLGLTGFHYLASKFRRAFFPNYLDNQILTTVAALAGCDYDDDALQTARAIIVKSKLGGLRIKHQNKRTMQMTLTAILRYVGHFVNTGDAWRNSLVTTIGGDAVFDSLHRVHQVYYCHSIQDDSNEIIRSLEYHRLIDSGMFFCRPLIEKWSSPPIKPALKACRAPTLSKRSRKRRKRKLREASATGAEDETLENPDLPVMECIDLADDWLCLGYKEIQKRKCSMWTLPHFKRVRVLLYSLLAKPTTGARVADFVTEWRRIGNNQSLEYIETRVSIPADAVAPTVEDMIKSCNNADSIDATCAVDLTPCLLPPTVRWVWYLLMAIPRRPPLDQSTAKTHHDSGIVANLMCLAYFHSRLAIEVLIAHGEESQPHRVNDQSLEKLDTDVGVWIFSIIQDMDTSDLPKKFFESPQVVATNFGDEWRTNLLASKTSR